MPVAQERNRCQPFYFFNLDLTNRAKSAKNRKEKLFGRNGDSCEKKRLTA